MAEIFTNEIIFLTLTLTLVMTGVMTILITYTSLRERRYREDELRYNFREQRAEYDEMRAYFEQKIDKLEDRLLNDSYRWKEIFQLQRSGQEANPSKQILSQNSSSIISTSFFDNLDIVVAEDEIDESLVFVLTPYNDEEFITYKVINQICNSVGLRCLRGDEEAVQQRDILSHILKSMVRARIIIANINGRNPNVFYELGIAHAISKPTILVGNSIAETPFDVQSRRIILYKSYEELERKLALELTRTVLAQKSTK